MGLALDYCAGSTAIDAALAGAHSLEMKFLRLLCCASLAFSMVTVIPLVIWLRFPGVCCQRWDSWCQVQIYINTYIYIYILVQNLMLFDVHAFLCLSPSSTEAMKKRLSVAGIKMVHSSEVAFTCACFS